MPLVSSLIRIYTSQDAYERDATRLARLGYIVVSVIEEEAYQSWLQRLQTLFGSAPRRLVVTYTDHGVTAPL